MLPLLQEPEGQQGSVLARENVAAYLALLLELADTMAATAFPPNDGSWFWMWYNNIRDPRARMVNRARQLISDLDTRN